MAGASLLTLIDDIAYMLDDVAAMTKVATKKTAGVLGDDLALNAQQVTGVTPDRELPVVWAVAKGAAFNKMILVPAALVISVISATLVKILLMCGGLFLCFEGVEKVVHKLFHKEDHGHGAKKVIADPVEYERNKVKGAIRTDFILSAEIIVIALGTVADKPFATKALVLVVIAALMNVFVYGLVAGIVKLDDAGIYLSKTEGDESSAAFRRKVGEWIILAAPYLMKALGILGTLAMFLVGGDIIAHNIGPIHHWVEHMHHEGGFIGVVVPKLASLGIGILAGSIVLGIVTLVKKVRGVDAGHGHGEDAHAEEHAGSNGNAASAADEHAANGDDADAERTDGEA